MEEWRAQLEEVAARDLPLARRAALLRLVWREAHLTREGLMARVEALLGRGCFGQAPEETFQDDLGFVRAAIAERGFQLRSGGHSGQPGYYVEGRPPLDERLAHPIAGSVAEVDPRQMVILKRFPLTKRFQQGRSMMEQVERVAVHRVRQRHPEWTKEEVRQSVRERRLKAA